MHGFLGGVELSWSNLLKLGGEDGFEGEGRRANLAQS